MWNELHHRAAPAPPIFDKSVEMALKITAGTGGKEHFVAGDQIERLDLELRAYGFAGVVRFWAYEDSAVMGDHEDKLHAVLTGLDQITVELRVRAFWPERERKGDEIRALLLRALVGERGLRQERDLGQSGRHRRVYSLHFYDPAYLLWRSHFPSELFTQKSVKQVIEAHKPEAIKIRITSQAAAAVRPLIFLGHSPDVLGSASFYDFLIWYADTSNLKFFYDYVKQDYVLADARPAPGTAIPLDHSDLRDLDELFAEVPRYKPRVHNVCAAAAQTQIQANAKATVPLVQDHYLRVKVSQEVEQRGTLEEKRLYLPKPAFRLSFGRLPVRMLMPGDALDLRKESQWRQAGVALPQSAEKEACRIRCVTLSLENQRAGSEARARDSLGTFRGSFVVEAEPASEAAPQLPPYVTPTYPRHCEGTVLVDGGADNEEIYQILSDSETSIESYRVAIPTWENQEIRAPFDTHQMPGHFYFPAYKHETVLVAFYFDRAVIAGFVDWRAAGARVPKESQGNHLLMGKTSDNNTSMRHIYEENKPVFSIHRTNKSDHQLIQIKEGNLLIQVKEEAGKGA